jgi:hypothetical protein
MIDISEIQNALRLRIAQSGIIPVEDIAWENLHFSSQNKTLWMRENYLPATEEAATSSGDMVSGIFQYSIFTPVGKADVLAVNTGVAIGSLFGTQEVIDTTNYRTSISRTKCSFKGSLDDIWFSYIIDVEFVSYE